MVRTNQGGSILSFLIVGGVLALLLVGAAYVVRHNFSPAERRPEVAVSDEDKQPSQQESTDDQSDAAETPEQTTTPDTGNAKNDTATNEQPAPSPQVNTSQPPAGLPTTGPADMLFGGIMLSGLTGLAAAYVQSRRRPASL